MPERAFKALDPAPHCSKGVSLFFQANGRGSPGVDAQRAHGLGACYTRLQHTRTSRITSSAWLLLIALFAFLIAQPAAGQTVRGEEYEAQTYNTTSFSVRSGESPEAVCARHTFAYGWNDPPYSKQVHQIAPGRWVCQLYYEGRIYPGMAVQIVGGCQAEPVVPLGQLAGRYVGFPYWDDQKAVCYCNSGHTFNRDIQWCEAGSWSRKPEPGELVPSRGHMCPAGRAAGNPILLGTAEKSQVEVDFADAGASGLSFARTYRSAYRSSWRQSAGARAMGKAWTHSHQTYLTQFGNAVTINAAEGDPRTFIQPSGATTWQAEAGADTLVSGPSGWTWRRSSDDSTWQFDSAGKVVSVTQRNGWTTTYVYDAGGQLTQVQGPLNRTLTLAYNTAGQLITMTTPEGRSVGYEYDTIGRLSLVRQGDNTTRSYLYENAAFPEALTGIVDEAGTRYATYGYDSVGRASTTEHAGATGRYQVSYPNNPGNSPATVVDPLGTTRTFSYTTTQGKRTITSGSLPSGTGESDAAFRVPDANGLMTSETDFKGVKTTTTWDVARRLPIAVTRAVGTPEAKTITTQWHPVFSLPALVTEAGRTTASTYDDKGNVLSQAITDTASSPNTTRTWQWTWNAQGLAATETEPNGAVTTFEYDPRGNLVKSTNALGHVTQHGFDSAIYLPTANGPMPIAAVINGNLYAVHSDHLNTPRRLTAANGQVVWQWAYSAFGDEKPTIAKYRFADLGVTPNPGTTGISEVVFNLRNPGQYDDAESGLYQNKHRYYDKRLGRYTQFDLIGLRGGLNGYAYVDGNPFNYTDPNGLNPVAGAWAGAGAGSAFGPIGTVVGGLIGAGAGAWLGWNAAGPMITEARGWFNNAEANREWQAYKDGYSASMPPGMDPCEEARWRLKREQDLLNARRAWDAKWVPLGAQDHSSAIRQSEQAVKNAQKRVERDCKCP